MSVGHKQTTNEQRQHTFLEINSELVSLFVSVCVCVYMFEPSTHTSCSAEAIKFLLRRQNSKGLEDICATL